MSAYKIRIKVFVISIVAFISPMRICWGQQRVYFSPDEANWASRLKKTVLEYWQSARPTDTLYLDFREGTYHIDRSVKLTGIPSSNHSHIIIRGHGQVNFSGGHTLNALLLKSMDDSLAKARIIDKNAQAKVLEYDLKRVGVTKLGEIKCIGFGRVAGPAPAQLFYNGSCMTLARYPNIGRADLQKLRTTVIPITKIIDSGMKTVNLPIDDRGMEPQIGNGGAFSYTDPRINRWQNAHDIWLDGIFSRDWSWSLNKVKKIDTLNKVIWLQYKEKYELTGKNSFFFACNLLEELDQPGEYFIDREKEMLYFYPPSGFNAKTAKLELSETPDNLFVLKNVNNLKFINICFELGRLGAVDADNSDNITFTQCEFRNFGSNGIKLRGNNDTLYRCVVHNIGGTAVSLSGGDFKTLEQSHNLIQNCDIYNWASYNRVYTPAIALGGVGNKIAGNKLHNAPHGAITISGNDHTIRDNEIYSVLQEFRDFGAIYAFLGKNPLMRGHIICQNYFHDIGLIGDNVYAIYADEGTGGWLIKDNIFYKIGNKGSRVAAIFGNTCSHFNIENNIFLDCSETFELSLHFSTWGKKRYSEYFSKIWHQQFSKSDSIPRVYLEHYPELKNFLKEDRIYVNTNSFIGNLIENNNIPLSHNGYFQTASDFKNSDYLVISKDNQTISDIRPFKFLNRWNATREKKSLINSIPPIFNKYLIFNKANL